MEALKSAFAYLSSMFHRKEHTDSIGLVARDQLQNKQSYTFDLQNGCNGRISLPQNTTDISEPEQIIDSSVNETQYQSDEGTSNVWQAGLNVGNCMQGIGILSLPYTVKEGGTSALATMVAVLLIGNYTSKMLVRCMYQEEKSPENGNAEKVIRWKVHKTYANIADACYPGGSTVLNIMQLIDIIAVATLYLELAGSLMKDTFPFLGISNLWWTVICTVILLPTVFFKSLTNISWLSLVAIASLILMFSSVVWYSLGRSIHWDISSMPGFEIRSFSLSSSIILFNFGCQFLVPSVEQSMKDKSKFDVMVNWTYVITGILNLAYAFFAYLTFGDETKEFITYNMPLGLLQATVSLFFVIKSLLSYPLMIFLIVNTIDALNLTFLPRCYGERLDSSPPKCALIFRVALVMFTLLLAVAIPHFTLLMGFTGSLTAPWLDFIFPCLFYLKLNRGKLKWPTIIMNWCVIVIGFIGGIIGLVYSTIQLISAIWSDLAP